ncbi:MAG TPA: ATP-binding protein [Streptosporangiaceae bacterium]|nr:ATP-binding protein [Streptosporangiaceae bacterium]
MTSLSEGSIRVAYRTRAATRRSSLELDVALSSVRAARHWAADLMAQANPLHDCELVDAVVLLVSELVTNAIQAVGRMAATPGGQPDVGVNARVWLAISSSPDLVRIEVHDTACIPVPPSHRAEEFEESGRGLEVTSVLASDWGWNAEPLGKVVWCELKVGDSLSAISDRQSSR